MEIPPQYNQDIFKYLDDLLEFVSDDYVKSLIETHTSTLNFQCLWPIRSL